MAGKGIAGLTWVVIIVSGFCGLGLFSPTASATGDFLWTRQFGSSNHDYAYAVAVDASGAYVAGHTEGTFPGQTSAGGTDAFLRKYNHDGNLLWTRQFGTAYADYARAVAVDASGVYVAGHTSGTFPGQTSAGSQDVLLRKYDQNGNLLWTRQFGTSFTDYSFAVAVDASGVYVGGSADGTFPGQTSAGGTDAFLRKYDQDGNFLWTRQFGTSDRDFAYGVALDASGVDVGGPTYGTFPGQTSAGGMDAFLRRYDQSGNLLWTRQFGTSGADSAPAIAVDASGVYLGGGTNGTFPGQTNAGYQDAYFRKYDQSGNLLWTRQFGSSYSENTYGVAVGASGVYAAGFTDGTFPGQTSAGGYDAFIARFAELPGAPQNLQASAGDARVTLTWQPPATDGGSTITNYRIYRGTTSGTLTILATVANVLTYTDTSVTNGVTYYYQASAVNALGEGPSSTEVSATPTATPTAPSAPLNLQASAGDLQVTLSWQAPASDGGSPITNYGVYRDVTSGGETLLTTVENVLTYLDSGVANGVTYYYRVTAMNAVGEGMNSTEVSATPKGPPSAVQNLQVSSGDARATLAWQPPVSDGGSPITSYKLYRGTTSGNLGLLVTVPNVLTYTDTDLTNGVTYYYQVSAVNGFGEGPRSNEASAKPAVSPSAPGNLQATPGVAQVTLSWQAPSSDGGSSITNYKVYRGTSSGALALLTTVGNVLTYVDAAVMNGVTYYYQVSAVNAVGESPRSGEVSASTGPAPDTIKPTIAIASPSDGAILSSTSVSVAGIASDNVGLEKVELSTDGVHWIQAAGTTSWSATITLEEGTNTIYARATDTSGNTAAVGIVVTVKTAVAPAGFPDLAIGALVTVIAAIVGVVVAVLLRRRKKGGGGVVADERR